MADSDLANNSNELLKQILFELQSLNNKLALSSRVAKASGKEGASKDASSLTEATALSGVLETTEKLDIEVGRDTEDRANSDETEFSAGGAGDVAVANAKNARFRSRWEFPYYGPDVDSIISYYTKADEKKYPGPSDLKRTAWSRYLGSEWALQLDDRLPLTLSAPYLDARTEEEAEDILRTVRDYITTFAAGPAYSRFTVADYVSNNDRYREYFKRYLGFPNHLPDHDMTCQWDTIRYPKLIAPWRRYM